MGSVGCVVNQTKFVGGLEIVCAILARWWGLLREDCLFACIFAAVWVVGAHDGGVSDEFPTIDPGVLELLQDFVYFWLIFAVVYFFNLLLGQLGFLKFLFEI